jgi:hypothetical protein
MEHRSSEGSDLRSFTMMDRGRWHDRMSPAGADELHAQANAKNRDRPLEPSQGCGTDTYVGRRIWPPGTGRNDQMCRPRSEDRIQRHTVINNVYDCSGRTQSVGYIMSERILVVDENDRR